MNFKRGAATLFMVAMVVGAALVGGFAGSAAAAEPTTESSSDIQDGTTWADYNASPDDNKLVEFNNTDAADGALVVWDPETGSTPSEAQKHLDLDNSSSEFESTATGADSYAFNITADQLQTIPMEAGENKTVKFTIANQSDWDASDANLTTMDVTLDNTMERSVMYVGDYQIEQGAYGIEQTDEDGFLGVERFADRSTALDTTRDIDGSNTTVYAFIANDTAANHYDSDFGSLDSGDWTKDTLTQLDDENAVKNYASALPDDLSADTSALKYDTSGSTDALVLELGDEYDGQSTLDVSVNSDPGFFQKIGAYGVGVPFTDMNFGLPDWVPGVSGMAGADALALGVVVPIGLKRRSAQP